MIDSTVHPNDHCDRELYQWTGVKYSLIVRSKAGAEAAIEEHSVVPIPRVDKQ
jgi:hypothetical protein